MECSDPSSSLMFESDVRFVSLPMCIWSWANMYCLSPRIGTLVRMIFFFSLKASSVSTLQSKSGECPVINNKLYTAHSCRKSYSAVITVCMRTYNLNWKINLSVKQHNERTGDLINPFKSQMTFHWNSYRYKNKSMNKHVQMYMPYCYMERLRDTYLKVYFLELRIYNYDLHYFIFIK